MRHRARYASLLCALLLAAAGCVDDAADVPTGSNTQDASDVGPGGDDTGPGGDDTGPGGDDTGPSGDASAPACTSDADCAALTDGTACRVATCDLSIGICAVSDAPDGTSCDDGDACSESDTCATGVCAGGAAPSCDDDDPCTTDACDATDGCTHTPNTEPCDDGSACTDGDSCADGSCAGTPIGCDDGDPCTTDSCDATDGCAHAFNTEPCDDGDACTDGDACAEGACAGAAVSCDDGNPCTTDSCDSAAGCANTVEEGPCDDGEACTADDACADGACAGAAIGCDDGNPCTTDSCDTTTGCVYEPNALPCDDGDACTLADTCAAGACVGQADPYCGGSASCFDVAQCVAQACAGAGPACAKGVGLGNCLPDADSTATAEMATEYMTCVAGCTLPNGSHDYACEAATCSVAEAECKSGGIHGEGGCTDINDCLGGCVDSACAVACNAASTLWAAQQLNAVWSCVNTVCEGAPDLGACANANVAPGGSCADLWLQCLLDVPETCGNGTCDDGEDCALCGQDCGECPSDGDRCIDIVECLQETCLAGPPEDVAGCITGPGWQACTTAPESPEAVDLAAAHIGCVVECWQPALGAFDPLCLQGCVGEQADCVSGGVYGDGGCGDLNACSGACVNPVTASACNEACFQATSKESAMDLFTTIHCAEAACGSLQNGPCVESAIGLGGICSSEWQQCVDPAPLPVCEDGVCAPGETCASCPADCGVCPVKANVWCTELTLCSRDACAAGPTDAYAGCLATDGLASCVDPSTPEAEVLLAAGSLECWGSCPPYDDLCTLAMCPDPIVACVTGGSTGSGNCLALNDCVAPCGATADPHGCQRACAEQVTPDAVLALFAVSFCVQAECAGAPDTQACFQQVQAPGAPCYDAVMACVNQ